MKRNNANVGAQHDTVLSISHYKSECYVGQQTT